MKKFAVKALLFLSLMLLSFFAEAAAVQPVQPQQETVQKIDGKELKKRIKAFKKEHKAEMKGMSAKERKAYVEEGISREQLVPNGWLPIGITLIIIGAIMALFGGIIAWAGGAVALVGIAFVIVWLVKEINRPY